MPFTSFSFAVDHTNQAEDLILLENGILNTVMLGPEHIGTGNAEYYGQVLLVSSETPKPIPIAILASGYFGASVYIGWTGAIPLEPTYGIMARIWCENTIPVRCTVNTHEAI
jgi:hypothetical protein